MWIVFVEYQIEESCRQLFLDWAAELKKSDGRVEFYEGSEQPGLFVEIWNGLDQDGYLQMKSAGTASPAAGTNNRWDVLEPWIVGGREKIHIWRFEHVI